MKFEQSFICVYLSTRVFRDSWHLLIHFPRRLFVKLCLVFTARMCHERFCWSADDSWADPGMLRLTGSACLNVECSGEDQAPNQPSDLHCVSAAQLRNISIHHWTQHVHEQTGGHNRDQRRPNHSWVLPSSGQAPHGGVAKSILWKVSCLFFFFFYPKLHSDFAVETIVD